MKPGLERSHQPLTGAYPGPEEYRDFHLSSEAASQFHEQGCLTGLDLLGAAEVKALNERLDSIMDRLEELEPELYEVEAAWRDRPEEVVLHFLGAWRVDELFHDLVFHPGVTAPLAQLLDTPRLRFWHDQVFWKPPRHKGVVPYHQDYSYWTRTGPPAHLTMYISLDDMGPENGSLEYVRGSQAWGLLPTQDFGGDLDALSASLSNEQLEEFRPEPVRLKAGQASIHHSHLVHGSRANTSDRPRRAIVLNYMADGTCALDSEPLLRGVPSIPSGTPVEGEFFPIALDCQRA